MTKPFRHLSISKKLLTVIMVTTSSALVLACLVILLYDLLLYRESITQELTTQADIIGANSAMALATHDAEMATNILQALRFQPTITQASIYQKDGSFLATFYPTLGDSITMPGSSQDSLWSPLTTYSLVREIIHDGERIGTIYIQSSFADLFDRWSGFMGIVLGVMFASGLFALVLSSRFQQIIADPIIRLTALANRISTEQNYGLRETATSQDEIGTLIQGINNMLEQIQSRDRQLKRHREELEQEVEKRTADLAKLHQEVQLILQTAGEGIFGVDTTDTITFINPAAARMLGYEPARLVGQSFHAIVHHSKPDGTPYLFLNSPIYRSYMEGREFQVDNEVLWHRNGTGFQVEYTSTPMRNEDDTVIGAVVTFRDITERRQVEHSILEAKQAAETANQAKSQFLANMSHEIRTPMTGVLGMTELLLNSPLSSRQKHYAETVLRSGRNLLHIINDILDFSKMEARKLALETIDFPLHATVEDAAETFAQTAQAKQLELVTIIDRRLPDYAIGDPGRLTQVLSNLIGNALKFTSEGEVLVEARLADQFTDPFLLTIEVRDTGIGISPSKQSHIFEAFSQADESTTRQYGGTGLGLAISQELVELMGGQLQVSSDGIHGTSFVFTIPLGQSATPPNTQPALPFPTGCPTLLIENHDPTRTMIAHWLEEWGLTVFQARTGEEGLQMIRERRGSPQGFDLLIIDQTLPDVSGLELFSQIATEDPPYTPFTLILAPWNLDDPETRLTLSPGIQGLLPKPLRRAHLYEALLQDRSLHQDHEPPTGFSPKPQETVPTRILLAEDHQVNQDIVKALAEHLHFHLDVVENGQQALEALANSAFDLVLMDWQMPELDGLSACKHIRKQGIRSRSHTHLPVIAYTALNTPNEREQCLAAGIDDILPKPCNMEQFQSILLKWIPSIPDQDSPTPSEASTSQVPLEGQSACDSFDPSALDRIKTLQRPGGPDLITKVLTTYLHHSPKLLDEMRDGAARQDPTGVGSAVHTLKSSSASIGALRVAELCRELETQAKAHDLTQADSLIHQITTEYECVTPMLSALCTEVIHG